MSVFTARAAADMFTPLFEGAGGEKLAVAHLDSDRKPLAVRETTGSFEDEIELPVREILRDALRLGSASIVIAHNHPSGDPSPSRADIQAMKVLVASARALGIGLDDHLIYAAGEWRSFRQLGLL